MIAEQGNVKLLGRCGLYCGQCGAYRKGRCPGCSENAKASWCKVRTCTGEREYATCAECTDFEDPSNCRKYNTFISRLFGFFFRSDRTACIRRIRQVGPQEFANEMAAAGRQSIRR